MMRASRHSTGAQRLTIRSIVKLVLLLTITGLVTPVLSAEPDEIRRWIVQLENTTFQQRIAAASKLAEFGSVAQAAIGPLVKCLDDSNADVRLHAAQALGKIARQPEITIPALASKLRDTDEHVRYSAEWSLVRVTRQLNCDEIGNTQALRMLCEVLKQAASDLSERNHQPRNLIAIREVIKTVEETVAARSQAAEQQSANLKAAAEQQRLEAENQRIAEENQRAADAIKKMLAEFLAGGIVERLQFLEKLADPSVSTAAQRMKILETTFDMGDFRLIDYALDRWGEHGQAALRAIFDSAVAQSEPDENLATILAMFSPQTEKHLTALMTIAANPTSSDDNRVAAVDAIGRAKNVPESVVQQLVPLAGPDTESEALRFLTIETLGNLGASAAGAVPQLIQTFNEPNGSTTINSRIASALGRISPTDSQAVDAIIRQMNSLDPDDYFFLELMQALAQFGQHASAGRPVIVRGLQADDNYFQIATAEALANTCPSSPSPSEVQISESLVARILDKEESISVKAACATAIKATGPSAVALLAQQLSHENSEVRQAVLRSLAIVGVQAAPFLQKLTDVLTRENEQLNNRAAAANVLGEIGSSAGEVVRHLQSVITSNNAQPRLLGPALVALARVDPNSRATIAPYMLVKDYYVRACAALALHCCGETAKCVDSLLQMLDDAEDSQPLEDTLYEIGSVSIPALTACIRDQQANDQRRLAAYRVLVRLNPPDWQPLVEVLGDTQLGQEFSDNLLAVWDPEMKVIPTLVHSLSRVPKDSPKRQRVRELLEAMNADLGAAGDEPQWPSSHALLLAETGEPSEAHMAMSAEEVRATQPEAAPKRTPSMAAKATAPPTAESIGEPSRTAPDKESGESFPIFAPAGVSDDAHVESNAPAADRVVRVFYGTNRVPLRFLSDDWRWPAAIGLAVATILFCVMALIRINARRYAIVALAGLAVFCVIGYGAMSNLPRMEFAETTPAQYGGEFRDQTDLGICDVSIPTDHRPGELEAPSLLRLEFKQDPNKHVVVRSVHKLDREEFYAGLSQQMDQRGRNLLVFIHGYNVAFEDAARRTAQMAFDLKFAGAPVFFSWPSHANWYRYGDDKKNIELSVERIKTFLLDLAANSQADSINLIAHSMGTVGLTEALREIQDQDSHKLFNQVVLAAPDIDADIFVHRIAPNILAKAHRITMYTSDSDLALIASRYFNHGPRAGDSGKGVVLFPGIETIDASAVDTSLLGHSYYGSNVSVLHDIGRLLQDQPIENRHYLRPISNSRSPLWSFDPARLAERETTNAGPVR